MDNSIERSFSNPEVSELLSVAQEKAKATNKTQLIFLKKTPVYFTDRIINEQCVFLHPDGRITCVENHDSALELIKVYGGEVYLSDLLSFSESATPPLSDIYLLQINEA